VKSTGGFPFALALVPSVATVASGLVAARLWAGKSAVPWGTSRNVGWAKLSRGLLPLTGFWLCVAVLIPYLYLVQGVHGQPARALCGVLAIAIFVAAAVCFVIAQTLIFRGWPQKLIPPQLRA
jgi:hypothetical protein